MSKTVKVGEVVSVYSEEQEKEIRLTAYEVFKRIIIGVSQDGQPVILTTEQWDNLRKKV
jgi:hypothetical protein